MFADAKKYFMVLSFTFLFLTFTNGPVFSTSYTLDAKDDAGLYPGQGAYAQFVGSAGIAPLTAAFTLQPPTSAAGVVALAPPGTWLLTSAGNIWSSDKIVGESIDLSAGMYRISVDVDGGAFTYDSFGWSEYHDKWLWGMNIESRWTDGSGNSSDYKYWLGSGTLYGSPEAALQANAAAFIDIGLGGPGSLSFWIADWNSIDNSGSLTFSITSVPEPPSLLFLAAVLPLLLVSRVRNYLMR